MTWRRHAAASPHTHARPQAAPTPTPPAQPHPSPPLPLPPEQAIHIKKVELPKLRTLLQPDDVVAAWQALAAAAAAGAMAAKAKMIFGEADAAPFRRELRGRPEGARRDRPARGGGRARAPARRLQLLLELPAPRRPST